MIFEIVLFLLIIPNNCFGNETNTDSNIIPTTIITPNSTELLVGSLSIVNNLNKKNFLIGITQIGSINGQDNQCERDLAVILKSIENHEIWALKLIDDFGNVPNGVSWGNYFWFSSRELCNDFNDPYNISLAYSTSSIFNATSPFDMKFFMIYYNFSTPFFVDIKLQYEPIIHVGLCLPISCSESNVTNYANQYFATKSFEPQQLFDIEMKQIGSKVQDFNWTFFLNPGVIIFMFIVLSFTILSTLAIISKKLRNRQRPKNDKPDQKDKEPLQQKMREPTSLEYFLHCFDIQTNSGRAMKFESSKDFFPIIAGMRTVVCFWVTLFHVYYYSLFTIKNVPMVFAKLESLVLQPVLQSCFYVDVFFVISSFLLVSNFLGNKFYIESIQKNTMSENVKLFLKFVLHRYARIMPLLILTMLLSEVLFELLDMYSPFWMDKYNGIYCREYTWLFNILLVNNFLDLKYVCASWSWYLGCEMQFFILFLFFIFIYIKNEKMGKFIFTISAIIFVLIGFYCNYHEGITFQIDKVYTTLQQLYVKPYIRINPYFGGAFMGWIYHQQKDTKLNLNPILIRLFWLFACCIYFTTILMCYWRDAPTIIVASVMSFGKLFFGIFIGCIIILCQNGYGVILTAIIANPAFLFMNKFCFSIYMLAPVIISALFGLRTESTLFSEISSVGDLFGVFLISIIGSLLAVIFIEIPFIKLSNKFILPKKTN